MINLPKKLDTLNNDEREPWLYAQECLENIKQEFELRSTNKPNIRGFHILDSKKKVSYYTSWEVKDKGNSFKLCLVQYDVLYHTAAPTGGHSHSDSHLYFYGYLILDDDFGVGIIRPETLVDKLSELFIPIEIDFESHPKFSYKYYVLSEDAPRFLKALKKEHLDFIQDIKGLQIEFRNKTCLFRLAKAVDKEESIDLCKVGIALDKIFNLK